MSLLLKVSEQPGLDPETPPQGHLQEKDLRHLVGFQVAKASIVTLAIFDEVVGQPEGLRTVEYTVLALIDSNGSVAPAQLAKTLNLSPSYITVALDKLEARGFINRQADQRDRRGQRLTATTKGHQEALRLTRRLIEAERRAISTLSPVEQLMLAELLGKLARSRSVSS
jgi:DNA-binding MarR family transcriptional regulator